MLLRLSKDAILENVSGEAVLYNLKTRKLFELNNTAFFILKMLRRGTTLENIKESLKKEYCPISSNYECDLEKFINSLKKEGFLSDRLEK